MNIMISLSEISHQSDSSHRSHAIVIGGSMAGMLAARVLSEHFDQVTLIERDRFSESPASRPGVPQARHFQVLLSRGLNIVEGLFPKLSEEMIAAGAVEIDAGADLAWLNPAGWGINFKSGLKALSFSRDLLDWSVRRRVPAIPNIRLLENCEMMELITNERRDAIAGVLFRYRNQSDGAAGKEDWLAADLVVDAGGRASKIPQWLSEIGYEPPAETAINAHPGYASRLYKIPADFNADRKALAQASPPEHIRGGIMFAIEGDRWIVTLAGRDRDYPPTDEEGFLTFARSLRNPLIYEAIKNAEPLTPITGDRGTENRWRHYELLERWPESLIAIGDSVCSFNPVYGQEMATAPIGAEWLDKCLREQSGDLNGLARRFQRGLARLYADPWMLSTGEDYPLPQRPGRDAEPDEPLYASLRGSGAAGRHAQRQSPPAIPRSAGNAQTTY